MKFYWRASSEPRYAQDYPTLFFRGRWLHQYAYAFNLWLMPSVDAHAPEERPGCTVARLSFWSWLRLVGLKRGFLEILEDVLGRRRWTPRLDRGQDFSIFDRMRQPPRLYLSAGK